MSISYARYINVVRDGGDGGGLGQSGSAGQDTSSATHSFPGGSPGNAIDGDSYVTFDTEGTILGARVN